MDIKAQFVAYVDGTPEFVVYGSDKVPDGTQWKADTLLKLGIHWEPFSFPDYWHWVRERFRQRLKIRKMLNDL